MNVFWSLGGSLGPFSFHKLHGFVFDFLDALRCAVFLLILQVALEKELDLLHGDTQVDRAIKERPAGRMKLGSFITADCEIGLNFHHIHISQDYVYFSKLPNYEQNGMK